MVEVEVPAADPFSRMQRGRERRRRRKTISGCRLGGARENFSIIAATVIKPSKREIIASTRDYRHAAPLSKKLEKFAAALMALGKATKRAGARGSKVVHHQRSS